MSCGRPPRGHDSPRMVSGWLSNRTLRRCPAALPELRRGCPCCPDGRHPVRTLPQAPEQAEDMAVAGSRPSMHAPSAVAVDASRRMRCLRRQRNLGRGRRSRRGCPPHGVLPQPADTAAASAVLRNCGRWRCRPDGRCPPRTPQQPAGVRRYRNRSSGRRPLDGCRHCRYAWVSWRCSRSRAGRAHRSWPAAPAPAPPGRSARPAAGPAGRRAASGPPPQRRPPAGRSRPWPRCHEARRAAPR
jgi:hypothetical protein